MQGPEIGIVDTRNIVRTIKETHDFDFSDYALTSLKRRFERILVLNNIKSVDLLLTKLREDKEFFNIFLRDIFPETTEMFRDPSLWRWLRDALFPDIITEDFRILIPNCVGGDELFTLAIVLDEMGLLNKVQITATSISSLTINKIKEGFFSMKKVEISMENYKRYQGDQEFDEYISISNNNAYRRVDLISNVDFKQIDLLSPELPGNNHLILFRNHLIYYNQKLQDLVLNHLYERILPGGYLIIGIGETMGRGDIANGFNEINNNERIYKKKGK